MGLKAVIIFLLIATCSTSPVDYPVRIDLPVYNQPESGAELYLSEPLKPENYPGGELVYQKQAPGQDFVKYKLEAASNLLGSSVNDKANAYHEGGLFSAPISTRETVLQETEGYGSKTLSFKENLEKFMADILQPKPIVDTISEDEKYGNTGDKFYSAGKALVGGAEGISNAVNSALEVPSNILRSITKFATEKLNNLGGKIVGL